MKQETGIVGNSFPGKITVREGYSEFFNGLMDIVRDASAGRNGVDGQTGESLRSYVMDWLGKHPLQDFNEYSDTKYIRSYIGRCPETHWETIVMSWKRGNTTTIHGHPQFAAYNFADGVFRLEIFEKVSETGARKIKTVEIDRPGGFFALGDSEDFDNHIHRITCLSDTGHSLHVYSDDALKGKVYTEIV